MTERAKEELRRGYIDLKDHFDALWEEREKRFALQNGTIDRRLEVLNKLRQELIADREQFVLRTVYDIKTKWYDEWCREVDEKLTTLNTRSITWTTAIGLFFTILMILLKVFWGG